MRIVFLGTAGDAQARQQHASGGVVLDVAGGRYVIDPGPGASMAARNAKVSLRDAICVLSTNNSLLSSGGVNDVLDAMTLSGEDRFGVLIAAESVVNGTEDEHPVLSRRAASYVERVVTFKETTRIGVNQLNIYPRAARHEDPTAIGLRLEAPSLTIGYTGSTRWFSGLVQEHKGSDVLIIKCLGEGSLSADEASQLIKKVKPRSALLTGFSGAVKDPLAVARRLHKETGAHVVAAKDGYEMTVSKK